MTKPRFLIDPGMTILPKEATVRPNDFIRDVIEASGEVPEFGIPAGSIFQVGAGQTGKSIVIEGCETQPCRDYLCQEQRECQCDESFSRDSRTGEFVLRTILRTVECACYYGRKGNEHLRHLCKCK